MSSAMHQTKRLEQLQALTDAALAHLDSTALLSAILARTRETLAVDTCAILLLDETTNELVARAAVGIEEEVEQCVRIPVGRGFAGTVAATKKPVFLPDVDHANVLNPLLRQKGIKSLLGVPLLVEGRTLGVVHVGSLRPRTFTAEETQFLQLAADRAAIAIEHARLFEAERAARIRMENLQAVTDAALAHLDLSALLEVLLPRIRAILHADTCAVLLLDEATDELVARAAVGMEEEVEQGVRIPVGHGFAGTVAARREPVILDDVDHADVLNPLLRQKGIKSMVGVPLLVRGDAIGVLHVGTLTPRLFTTDDVELLQLVAERVALAIGRAQLHQATVQLEQLRLNFVAIASHELRTPATVIYGVFTTLAARGDDLRPEIREQLMQVGHEQAVRLRRLLEELLDLSQVDSHEIRVEPKPLVVHSLLSRIAADAAPDTRLELQVSPDLATVADPFVIDRVVSNLISNAARYGEPPIVIRAEQRDSHLRIAVEDHGSGVPRELRDRLFERFARGSADTGSGLGLSIARAYARAHGGELLYDDSRGSTCFELVVPQASRISTRGAMRPS
ncbi:MAG: GAF domain-containing protein [Gaiellaceae bacterium]